MRFPPLIVSVCLTALGHADASTIATTNDTPKLPSRVPSVVMPLIEKIVPHDSSEKIIAILGKLGQFGHNDWGQGEAGFSTLWYHLDDNSWVVVTFWTNWAKPNEKGVFDVYAGQINSLKSICHQTGDL